MPQFIIADGKTMENVFETSSPDEYVKYLDENKNENYKITLKNGDFTFEGSPEMIDISIKMCNEIKQRNKR